MYFKRQLKYILRTHFSRKVYDIQITSYQFLRLERESLLSYGHSLIPSVQRDFCVFCIGLPRTGTHSLAHMFGKHFRAAHEPKKQETIINILDWKSGRYSKSKMLRILALRDKRLKLNLEASHYLHHIVDLLVELFPQAKFILTVREPISWLASETNQNYRTRNIDFWRSLEQYRYGRYCYVYEYKALEKIDNVYPIIAYLSYWKDHIAKVLNHVPRERLLIVDTFDIAQQLDVIASFVGINSSHLDLDKQWSGKRKESFDLYKLIDRSQVLEEVEVYCKDFIEENLPLLSKYF